MVRQAAIVLYVLAMVALVVGVDILFLRHQLWVRLAVNVGIVLVFAAFYLRFLGGRLLGTRDGHRTGPHTSAAARLGFVPVMLFGQGKPG